MKYIIHFTINNTESNYGFKCRGLLFVKLHCLLLMDAFKERDHLFILDVNTYNANEKKL